MPLEGPVSTVMYWSLRLMFCAEATEGKVDSHEGHGEFVAREPRGTVKRALSAWKELTAPRPVERSGIPATGV